MININNLVDKSTVKITLEKPNGDLVSLMGILNKDNKTVTIRDKKQLQTWWDLRNTLPNQPKVVSITALLDQMKEESFFD